MKIQYTFWQEEDGKYLGYLDEYPDHWTQGEDLEDLKEHLKDLYKEFSENFISSDSKSSGIRSELSEDFLAPYHLRLLITSFNLETN